MQRQIYEKKFYNGQKNILSKKSPTVSGKAFLTKDYEFISSTTAYCRQ
jgi:hypothetical protein